MPEKHLFIKKNSPNYVGKWSCVEGYHMSNKHTDQSVYRRGMARVLTFFLFESLGTQNLFSLVDRT